MTVNTKTAFLFSGIMLLTLLINNCGERQVKIGEPETKILGHRGSGAYCNDSLYENTLKSVIYGLQKLDGVEIDIQMSADSTVWLFHDETFVNESGDTLFIISEPDSVIQQFYASNAKIELCRLAEVFLYMKEKAGWLCHQPIADLRMLPGLFS